MPIFDPSTLHKRHRDIIVEYNNTHKQDGLLYRILPHAYLSMRYNNIIIRRYLATPCVGPTHNIIIRYVCGARSTTIDITPYNIIIIYNIHNIIYYISIYINRCLYRNVQRCITPIARAAQEDITHYIVYAYSAIFLGILLLSFPTVGLIRRICM